MMEHLTELLLTISSALLIPDIIAILLLCVFTLYQAGGLAAELFARKRVPSATGALLARVQARIATGEDREQVLDDLELQVERQLARLQLGIRLGPVLGLAGTLIPLGPAMGALATGDVATLSSQLVVSFTTTVLGLLVGAVCFVLHTVRRNWYRQDLTNIDHAVRQTS